MKLTILLGHLSLLVTYSNPVVATCVDSFLRFRVEEDARISYESCTWVKDNVTQRCSIEGVRLHCPKSCNTCGTHKCRDGKLRFKYETGSKKTRITCNVIKRDKSKCVINGVSEVCRRSCEYCALPPDSLQDSKYKFKINGTKDRFKCSDLAMDKNDLCNDQDVQSHCPVTCGSPKMCRDSQVKFKTKKNGFKYCWKLDNICGNLDGRLTCRSTCKVCNPVAPSQLSSSPSQAHTESPSYAPSSSLSTGNTESPSYAPSSSLSTTSPSPSQAHTESPSYAPSSSLSPLTTPSSPSQAHQRSQRQRSLVALERRRKVLLIVSK